MDAAPVPEEPATFDLLIRYNGRRTLLKVAPTTKLSKVFNRYAKVRSIQRQHSHHLDVNVNVLRFRDEDGVTLAATESMTVGDAGLSANNGIDLNAALASDVCIA
eukprot:20110-Heterococcus_DN1.PRE.2